MGLSAWSPSPAKVRNAVVVLRSRIARPENWQEEAWETHLEEIAKLILFIGRVGGEH